MGMNPANSRLMKCIERLSCARLLEVTPVNNIKDADLGVIPEYWAGRHFEIVKSFGQLVSASDIAILWSRIRAMHYICSAILESRMYIFVAHISESRLFY